MPSKTTYKRVEAFGILNAYGQPWTSVAFAYEEDARAHLSAFQINNPQCDMSGHKIVEVKIVYALPTKPLKDKKR